MSGNIQKQIEYLDEVGVRDMARQLVIGMNTKIADSIVDSLESTANRDDRHSLSAAGLFSILGATNSNDQNTLYGKLANLSSTLSTLQQEVGRFTHLQIEVITGPIQSCQNPNPNKLYLQRDDATDQTFVMYIYRENIEVAVLDSNGEPTYDNDDNLITQIVNQWVPIGKTDINLNNYWSKDEVDELKTALSMYNINFIENDNVITNAVNTAFADSAS